MKPLSIRLPAKEALYELTCPLMSFANGEHGDFGNLRKSLSIVLPAKEALFELTCPLMSIANGGSPLCNSMINYWHILLGFCPI
jgi:hypothetical protein